MNGLNRQTYEQISNIVDRKDNTWLQLDVCPLWRDTRRCPEGERCCHAHPPENIEILERYVEIITPKWTRILGQRL